MPLWADNPGGVGVDISCRDRGTGVEATDSSGLGARNACGWAEVLTTAATVPLAVGADRPQEVDAAERRPVGVAKVVLTERALPEHEPGQAQLA